MTAGLQKVAFDSVGPSAAGTGNTASTTLSWTHTAAAANVAILVGCQLDKSSDAGMSMTCTCDGTAMTSIGTVHSDAGTAGFLQAWSVFLQASGAHAIVVTAAGGTPGDLAGGSLAFTGAAKLGTAVTASGSGSPAATVSATTAGNMIAGFAQAGDIFYGSANLGQFLNNLMGSAGSEGGNIDGAVDGCAGPALTMTWNSNTATWAALAVEVQAGWAAGLPSGAGTAQSPATSPGVLYSSLNYPQNAADLGGASGVWLDPFLAAGLPP